MQRILDLLLLAKHDLELGRPGMAKMGIMEAIRLLEKALDETKA